MKEITLGVALRAARINHWVKNLLIFMPLMSISFWLKDGGVRDNIGQDIFLLAIAFLGISFFHSACYILNDYFDMESDMLHPSKKFRPFASGEMALKTGFVYAMCFVLCALLAGLFSYKIISYFIAYAAIFLMYSLVGKFILGIDVVLLTVFYCIRIYLGFWLVFDQIPLHAIGIISSVFLALAAIKRQKEFEISTSFRFARYSHLFETGVYLKLINVAALSITICSLAYIVDADFGSSILKESNLSDSMIFRIIAYSVATIVSVLTLNSIFTGSYKTDDISNEVFKNKVTILSFFTACFMLMNA